MDILQLEAVTKRFGSTTAIDSLSMSVPEHSVFGFIGKNGAGKTTTMKMILGFLKPDAGTIRVCDETVRFGNTKTNKYIGYLPDVPSFYGYMKPKEYLRMCGGLVGLSEDMIKERTDTLLHLTGLEGIERRIKGFSRGMLQRLGIAQALLNEPRLLICDEPTSALDPVGRKEILDILDIARERTTIIFSTHILSDVERICDRIGVIDRGRLVLSGSLQDLKEQYRSDSVLLEFKSGTDLEGLVKQVRVVPDVVDVTVSENALSVELKNIDVTGRKILEVVLSQHMPLLRYEVAEPTLERVFLEAVQ